METCPRLLQIFCVNILSSVQFFSSYLLTLIIVRYVVVDYKVSSYLARIKTCPDTVDLLKTYFENQNAYQNPCQYVADIDEFSFVVCICCRAVPKFMKRIKVRDYKDRNVFGVPLQVIVQRTGQPLPQGIQQAMRYLRNQCLDQVTKYTNKHMYGQMYT